MPGTGRNEFPVRTDGHVPTVGLRQSQDVVGARLTPHHRAATEGVDVDFLSSGQRMVLEEYITDIERPARRLEEVGHVGGADAPEPAAGLRAALTDPVVRVHLYGKEPRAGRKLGHVTVAAAELDDARARARRAAAVLAGARQEVFG